MNCFMNIPRSATTLFFALTFIFTLAACGGGNSSSDNSEDATTAVTAEGAIVTIANTELTVGDAASVTYNLGIEEITGTIHWDDGHTSRVRGSGVVRHGYNIAGSYSIGLQLDGGESSRVGVIVVSPAQVVEPESEEERTAQTPIINPTTVDCSSTTPVPIMLNTQRVFLIFTTFTNGSFFHHFRIEDATGTTLATSSLTVCPGRFSIGLDAELTYDGVLITAFERRGTTIFPITFQ